MLGHPAPRRETGQGTAGSAGDGVARCLTTGEAKRQDWETCNFVAHSLTAGGFDASEDGTGRGTPLVPVGVTIHGTDPTVQRIASYADVAQCLRARAPGNIDNSSTTVVQQPMAFDTTQLTSAANRSNPRPGDPCHPLAAGAHPPAIAFAHQAGGTQTTLGYDPEARTSPTLAKSQTVAAVQGMQVRRLTPLECERLQGFPDGWTDVPYRGKPAADGPRYKALGNSMAVNCMAWLGQRIDMVDNLSEAA